MPLQEVTKEIKARIRRDFTHHAPNKSQVVDYFEIRSQAKEFALLCVGRCPESRELSLALTKIEEAVMWANAAIARNE